MKTKTFIIVGILSLGLVCSGAETNAPTKEVKLTEYPNNPGRVYFDNFISLRTPRFSDAAPRDWLYGIGVGYQVNKYWAADARVSHFGFDTEDHLVQDIGGRVAARLPWSFLSPGVFLGASFDLEEDAWHLNPGISLELGVSKKLRGLSAFTEIGMDNKLKDGALAEPGWKLTGGLRWRF